MQLKCNINSVVLGLVRCRVIAERYKWPEKGLNGRDDNYSEQKNVCLHSHTKLLNNVEFEDFFLQVLFGGQKKSPMTISSQFNARV